MKTKLSKLEWVIVAVFLAIALVVLMAGCGVHVEMTYNPEKGTWDVYYANNRPFAPENATVKMPGGLEVQMGEQATQNAVVGKLTDAVVVLSGAGGG